MKELEDIAAEERKATAHVIILLREHLEIK